MRGYDLSQREKKYIDDHPNKFASVLASDLSTMYPEDNGGSRDKACINKYLRNKARNASKKVAA